MTVRELLARIDSRELAEWIAFYGFSPFGDEPADIRSAIVASTIANCMTVGGGFKPSEFLPEYRTRSEPQSDADIQNMVIKINAMLGGAVRK